ncbi:Protein of unknown function [Micromonospora lupini str. Lupac 08]|uniref:Uncharacterized protein n=1 Tax=Micromonospora lupini str. Lupac 08 TaxID=1150864 RepID=I0L704_9ACTN|nr:Protein of unknown function [Micromonospora lupini str. Lupac 08]
MRAAEQPPPRRCHPAARSDGESARSARWGPALARRDRQRRTLRFGRQNDHCPPLASWIDNVTGTAGGSHGDSV